MTDVAPKSSAVRIEKYPKLAPMSKTEKGRLRNPSFRGIAK